MAALHDLPHRPADDDFGHGCTDVPQLRRLQYFFGQMLGVQDFRSEQEYFREKLKLHNRCFHGYGTVCGLLVRGVPVDKECETDEDRKREEIKKKIQALQKQLDEAAEKAQETQPSPEDEARIKAWREELRQLEEEYQRTKPTCAPPPIRPTVLVECGIAVDCEGNEIIVRHTERVDLWSRLNDDERHELAKRPRPVYLSICFCERPVDPVRPVGLDSCEPRPDCIYGKIQDSYYFDVSLTPPPVDLRCESCCDRCKHRCLLLARIHDVRAEGAVEDRHIDNSVRRLLARYAANRIVGINWTHGAEYSIEEMNELLDNQYTSISNGGLVIRTERPIRIATLQPGVVDLWVIQGGGGKHADIYSLDNEITPIQPDGDGYARGLRIRYTGDEQLDNGDRVLVIVRGAFLLDDCCRPLDGAHVGGMVPILPDSPHNDFKRFDKPHTVVCRRDPYGPLASGYSPAGATTFESWFFAKREGGARKKYQPGPDRKQE